MKVFFTYFGGKYRIAPHYPKPQYSTVIEPFAGSAGYSLRYHQRNIVLLEKDPVLAGLWKYLIRVPREEIEQLPLLLPEQSIDDFNICQEAKWLIGFWVNKGGAHPCKTASRWMREGTRPHSFWGATIRQRIANQIDGIRHWKVIEGDYTQSPSIEATWFIDPPYELMGTHYKCSNREIDFVALSDWCQSRPGQIIVCESEGATWLPFQPFRVTRSIVGRQKLTGGKTCNSHEVIWTNDKETSLW